MTTLQSALAATATVLGVALAVLAVATYRRWSEPGHTSFAAFVGLLALAALGTGPAAETAGREAVTLWITTCAQLGTVAWVAFALRYTGRRSLFSPRVGWLMAAAYLGFLALPFALGPVLSDSELVGFIAISGYMLGLVATLLGAALVLETTYRHGYLSGWVGVALAFIAIDPWFLTLVGFASRGLLPVTIIYGLYASGFFAYVVVLSVVLFRSDGPAVTVATQTVGRRALLSETTDLVVVADDEGLVVERNEAVRTEIPTDAGGGDPVSALLGTTIDDLRERDSTELSTTEGRRQYDVQVTELTDRRDTSIGWFVSLRDITTRRRREQVLSVLNRVLRHNIRNELDVTKARVNFVAENTEDADLSEDLSRALSSVDTVLELADQARATQRALTADSAKRVSLPVCERVTTLAAAVAADREGTITVSGADVVIEADEELFDIAVENVLENALEHSTATEPRATVTVEDVDGGARVRVEDNGPGIPESEVAVIESGRETDTEHSTSIGLWLVEWATTACGGTVTFGEGSEGGRVDLWFPA